MAKKASEIVQVKVRMREDQRRRLERESERNGQTVNAEVLARLDRSFEIDAQLGDPATAFLFHSLARRVAELKLEAGENWGEFGDQVETGLALAKAGLEAFAKMVPGITQVTIRTEHQQFNAFAEPTE